jgi:polar amino acid transport system substrate-binding protein
VRSIRTPAALVLAAALALSACGGKDNGGAIQGAGQTTTSAAASSVDIAKLPAGMTSAKKVSVGSDVAYAPVEFFKEGTQEAQGLDVDICNAMVAKFGAGWSCEFHATDFAGIIPALGAKRFDIIMSAMSDNKKRQESVDFVDYFSAGTSILVAKGNPKHIQSLDDLCGQTIGLQKGTTQEDGAKAQAAKCPAGKKLTILTFEKDTDALLALKAGRSVADLNDFPVAAYNAKLSGGGNDFEVVGQQIEAGPYGIAFRKDDTATRDTFQAALKAIIADGTYDQILTKWNVPQGALKTALINGGT